jgi:hypothetical protein
MAQNNNKVRTVKTQVQSLTSRTVEKDIIKGIHSSADFECQEYITAVEGYHLDGWEFPNHIPAPPDIRKIGYNCYSTTIDELPDEPVSDLRFITISSTSGVPLYMLPERAFTELPVIKGDDDDGDEVLIDPGDGGGIGQCYSSMWVNGEVTIEIDCPTGGGGDDTCDTCTTNQQCPANNETCFKPNSTEPGCCIAMGGSNDCDADNDCIADYNCIGGVCTGPCDNTDECEANSVCFSQSVCILLDFNVW